MAACVCYNCQQPVDCGGSGLCDICEYDMEQVAAAAAVVTAQEAADDD